MTDIRITLLVATALLTTHHHQPKGRQIADRLQAHLDQLDRELPTAPKENER